MKPNKCWIEVEDATMLNSSGMPKKIILIGSTYYDVHGVKGNKILISEQKECAV